MNYGDLVIDFAERTLSNLDLVKQAASQGRPDAFEITQLWNSLLGLIVAPHEREVEGLPETSLAELHARGWPDITTAGHLKSDDLRGLVRALRNAVTHFNVNFEADGRGEEIRSVSLWNEATDRRHVWDGRLDVDQLEKLARNIAATYVKDLGKRAA